MRVMMVNYMEALQPPELRYHHVYVRFVDMRRSDRLGRLLVFLLYTHTHTHTDR